MNAPDDSLPLLWQVRIATEIGELSDAQISLFRQSAGLPGEMSLLDGYSCAAPLWAWHGPLLIGYGRVSFSATRPLWIDEVAVIPEYRDEGIEQEIVHRLAAVQSLTDPKTTPLLFGAAKIPTTLGMLLAQMNESRSSS